MIGRTQHDSIEPVSGVFFHLFIKMQMRSPPILHRFFHLFDWSIKLPHPPQSITCPLAYLAETLRSLCFVMLFVIGKGIHECKTKRKKMYMPCNLSSFLHVTTATNNVCVKRKCNHGFAPLNCDFEKSKAAVGVLYNVVQF